jgi:hypothetical protein
MKVTTVTPFIVDPGYGVPTHTPIVAVGPGRRASGLPGESRPDTRDCPRFSGGKIEIARELVPYPI